ncbi:MAG: hypothetical protein ACTSPL_04230 [Candidatus Odinarchaeia archaeon]
MTENNEFEISDEDVIKAIKNATGSQSHDGWVNIKSLYDELRYLLKREIPLYVVQCKLWEMYRRGKIRLTRSSKLVLDKEKLKYAIKRDAIYFYLSIKDKER